MAQVTKNELRTARSPGEAQRQAPLRSRRAPRVKGPLRCHACGNIEYSTAAAERHADAEGHRRYEAALDLLAERTDDGT